MLGHPTEVCGETVVTRNDATTKKLPIIPALYPWDLDMDIGGRFTLAVIRGLTLSNLFTLSLAQILEYIRIQMPSAYADGQAKSPNAIKAINPVTVETERKKLAALCNSTANLRGLMIREKKDWDADCGNAAGSEVNKASTALTKAGIITHYNFIPDRLKSTVAPLIDGLLDVFGDKEMVYFYTRSMDQVTTVASERAILKSAFKIGILRCYSGIVYHQTGDEWPRPTGATGNMRCCGGSTGCDPSNFQTDYCDEVQTNVCSAASDTC